MSTHHDAAPSAATEAVLVKSEAMPADAQPVEELDFNKLKGPITAQDLYLGMRHMGFQASSTAEAIRIINDMVSVHHTRARGTNDRKITNYHTKPPKTLYNMTYPSNA